MKRSLSLILTLAAGHSLLAQTQAPQAPTPQGPVALAPRLIVLDRAFEAAVAAKDFAAAERHIREVARLQPANVAATYNLAITIAAQDDPSRAGEVASLVGDAIERGFSDVARIRRDPLLARAREAQPLQGLLADWQGVLTRQREAILKQVQHDFPSASTSLSLPELRLELRSHLAADELREIATEIDTLATFVRTHVLPEGALQGDEPWVVVILPDGTDFQAWSRTMFGPVHGAASGTIGGLYEHSRKRLVALDAGATLRHELVHVFHQRWCERLGQTHPTWLLEGVACLVEDMDPSPLGPFPARSWRTNAAARMARTGSLPTLAALAGASQAQFTGNRALAHYAAARSIVLWAHENAILREWLSTFASDPQRGLKVDASGQAALLAAWNEALPEDARGKTRDDLERVLRDFARSHPKVPEESSPGMLSLGVVVETRAGQGLVVVEAPARTQAMLREGDVLLSLEGRPVRDVAELLRILPQLSGNAQGVLRATVRRGEQRVEVKAPVQKRR